MNYSYIQQNNEMVNATRRDNGYLLPYLSFLIASAEPESVLSGLAQSLRNVLQFRFYLGGILREFTQSFSGLFIVSGFGLLLFLELVNYLFQ